MRAGRIVRLAAIGVLLGCVMVLPFSVPTPAQAGPEGGGVGWQYHSEGRGFIRDPGGPTSDPGPPTPDADGYFWKTESGWRWEAADQVFWWDCNDTRDGDCGAVSYSCGGLWPPDQRPAIVSVTLRRHQDWPQDQWEFTGETDCPPVPDEDWVSIEEIVDPLDIQIFQGLGAPKIDIEPTPDGLVTLPVILSTQYPLPLPPGPGRVDPNDPTRVIATVTVNGITATITAQATYTWTITGNAGEDATLTGRGEPYNRSIDPRNDGGYYVSKQFNTTGPKTATLNVHWEGWVDVPDLGITGLPIEPYDAPPSTTTFQIQEAKPILGDR
jgi:hypothetical protein